MQGKGGGGGMRGFGGGGRGMGGCGGPRGGMGGPGGYCVCPNCGHRVPHERGVPCRQVQCPKCGTFMVRE